QLIWYSFLCSSFVPKLAQSSRKRDRSARTGAIVNRPRTAESSHHDHAEGSAGSRSWISPACAERYAVAMMAQHERRLGVWSSYVRPRWTEMMSRGSVR